MQYFASNLCVPNSIFPHFVMVIMCCGRPSCGFWCRNTTRNYFDKLDTWSKKEVKKDLEGIVCHCLRPSVSSLSSSSVVCSNWVPRKGKNITVYILLFTVQVLFTDYHRTRCISNMLYKQSARKWPLHMIYFFISSLFLLEESSWQR